MAKPKRVSAKLYFDFEDTKKAESVFKAVLPEKDIERSRCRVSMFLRESVLYVEIDAPNTASLRAAINSVGRWIALADEMVERCEEWKSFPRRLDISSPSSSRRSSRRRR
ncbi:MAG: KEOPS complex subunit Pcc1 [Candidatus Hadarchaeales archaeon]